MLCFTSKLSIILLTWLPVAATGLQVLPDGQGVDMRLMQMNQSKPWDAVTKIVQRVTGATKKTDDQLKAYHIAWLISGQVARFVYKDGTQMLDGGISGFLGCGGLTKQRCPGMVDVHIAVSNTYVKQFFGPTYRLPSYGDGAYKEARVERYFANLERGQADSMIAKVVEMKKSYLDAGAANVRVRILSNDEFEQKISDVRTRTMETAFLNSGKTKDEFDRFWTSIQGHEQRFETNGNMMYLRHLAYASALEFERTVPYNYTHVLYTREDNIFVHPWYTLLALAKRLNLYSSDLVASKPMSHGGACFVDTHCSFRSYSDKIYFANREGIEPLIMGTLDSHIDYMARWINVAGAWSQSVDPLLRKDPLQTEEYFKTLFDNAGVFVTLWNFNRTEARYATNKSDSEGGTFLCIPELYNRCTDAHVFPICD